MFTDEQLNTIKTNLENDIKIKQSLDDLGIELPVKDAVKAMRDHFGKKVINDIMDAKLGGKPEFVIRHMAKSVIAKIEKRGKNLNYDRIIQVFNDLIAYCEMKKDDQK